MSRRLVNFVNFYYLMKNEFLLLTGDIGCDRVIKQRMMLMLMKRARLLLLLNKQLQLMLLKAFQLFSVSLLQCF